jgi:copper transport protein
MNRSKRLSVIGVIVLGVLLASLYLPATIVSAHAYLIQSNPAANAHLAKSPERIDMIFSEAVEPSLSDIAVYDSKEVRVDNHHTQVDPVNPTHVWNSLPPLKDGAYLITWKVISKSDGHLTGESFPFTIGNIGSATPTITTTTGAPPAALPGQVIVKGLLYLAVALLCGGSLFEIFIWRPANQQLGQSESDWSSHEIVLRPLMTAGLVLLGIASLLGVLVQAAAFEGKPMVTLWDAEYLVVLTNTQYGILALARIILMFALAGLLLPNVNRWNRWAAMPLMAITALTLSLGSHAAAQSDALMVGADLIHVLAAAIWIGGLGAFLMTLLWARRLSVQLRSLLIVQLLLRFSTLAIASVLLLVLTGIYAAITDVGSLNGLIATEYGHVLIVKLVGVLAITAVGAYNHFVMTPRLKRVSINPTSGDGWNHFKKLLLIEACLGVMILLWVGLLTSLPMANEEAGTPRITQQQQADDLRVKLIVSPGKAGVINTYNLKITFASDGNPVTNTSRVYLLIYPSNDSIPPSNVPLSNVGEGNYTAQGAYFTYEDQWQLRGVIRRAGRYDTYSVFYIDTRGPQGLPLDVSRTVLIISGFLAGALDIYIIIRQKSHRFSYLQN